MTPLAPDLEMTGARTSVKLLALVGRRRVRLLIAAGFGGVVSVVDASTALVVYGLFGLLTVPGGSVALPGVGDVGRFLPGLDHSQLLLLLAASVVVLMVGRSAAYVASTYMQHRVASNTSVDVAKRLMTGYLAMPYAFHLHRNSAELVRNAWDATQRLASDVLVPLVRAVAEGLIITGLLAVLVLNAPAATGLAVTVFLPTVIVLLRVVNPRLKRLGRTQQDMSRASLASLQQGLAGVRDVKLLGRELHFVRRFTTERQRLARTRYVRATMSVLPKAIIEIVLVVFVAGFLFVTMLADQPPADALAVLGLFGFAAFRILPSLTQVLSMINSLRFAGPTIDDVYSDLEFFAPHVSEIPKAEPPAMPFSCEIAFDEVSFRYEGAHTPAVDCVSLRIPKGSSLGIVGPTGGGKTTLVDLLTGLLEPTSGRVLVDGTGIYGNLRDWQRNLGVVPQSIFVLDDSLRRNIAMGLPDAQIDEDAVAEALRSAQLEEFVASLPEGLDTVVGERGVRMSGGQRQRLAIARALYHRPSVLVFDEATSALDNVTERDFIGAVVSQLEGRTLIMVAHRITTVRSCDQIIVVEGGRITDQGTYDELLKRSDRFRQLAAEPHSA